MPNNCERTTQFQQAARLERLRTWTISLIYGLLFILALAAATRIPDYLISSDYARLIGTILFLLLTIVGLLDNIRYHIYLWRLPVAQES